MPNYLPSAILALRIVVTPASFPGPDLLSEPEQLRIDVFTVSTLPIDVSTDSDSRHELAGIAVHELDGIARFNASLSAGLARDPDIARQQVMQRFAALDSTQQAALQHSAEALALALTLGVKRYPAIVINSQCVVYGVRNVQNAIDVYRHWRLATTE